MTDDDPLERVKRIEKSDDDFDVILTGPDGTEVTIHVRWTPDGRCWVAVTDDYDGPGSPIATGATIEEAVTDLIEQLDDLIERYDGR